MDKFRFFHLKEPWDILPANLEDKVLLESNPSAGVGKRMAGQGGYPALYFPALPKAINSRGLGAAPHRYSSAD